jgi:hypothetical protein
VTVTETPPAAPGSLAGLDTPCSWPYLAAGLGLIFLGTPSSPQIRAAMSAGHIGCMVTPAQGTLAPARSLWAADCGCGPKADGSPGDGFPGEDVYLAWLQFLVDREGADPCDPDTSGMLFAVAPDVLRDAAATLERARRPYPMLGLIREVVGCPVAFVAQDGMEPAQLPWDDFDCLFVGGSKRWKASAQARRLVGEATRRRKWRHLGCVNTLQWLRFAAAEGYNSCDGTTLARGPDRNLEPMLRWMPQVNAQPSLW